MDETDVPSAGPPVEALEAAFHVIDVRRDGDRILYFGDPLVPHDPLMERVWPAFREAGYEVRLAPADRVDVDPRPSGDRGRGRERSGGAGGPFVRVDHLDESSGGASGEANGGWSPDGNARTPWAEPSRSRGDYVLVAEPVSVGVDGVPWTNVALAVATVLSTLWAGAAWYHIDVASNPANVLRAWPFTVAIMGVLGVHELGHYAMSRYHGVDATLPYFIPVPTLIGTMGAVIRMKGRMPDRKALFDIGVAGPLAGLVATVAVTAVGLHLDPVTVPESVRTSADAVEVHLGFPPLMYLIARATGQPLAYPEGLSVNPVVIGGWVGMFVTFLNMIPVGQLDGGHVLRAMLGDRQETVAALVPAVLFGLAGYLFYFREVPGNAVFIWVFWGVFAAFLAFVGPAHPVDDEPLDGRRLAVGLLTIALGVLCFTPVPIAIVQ